MLCACSAGRPLICYHVYFLCLLFLFSAGEGVYQAVRIEFSLKTSCYATMALREVCEVDSSAAHQATFSKSMKSANAAAGGHDGASSQQSC